MKHHNLSPENYVSKYGANCTRVLRGPCPVPQCGNVLSLNRHRISHFTNLHNMEAKEIFDKYVRKSWKKKKKQKKQKKLTTKPLKGRKK